MDWVILSSHWDHCRWTLQAFTNWLGNRCLAYPWRPSKQQDHALLRVYTLVLCNELQNSFLGLHHSVMTLFQNLPRELNIPIRLHPLIPRQSKHLAQELSFSWCLHLIFSVQRVDLFLQHFPHTWNHVFCWIQHFLVLRLLALLVILKHALISMFQQTSFGPLLELLSSLLHIEKLLINDLMHLIIEIN